MHEDKHTFVRQKTYSTALFVLNSTLVERKYPDILISGLFKKEDFSTSEKAAVIDLTYGVLRHMTRLDHIIGHASSAVVSGLDIIILNIIRIETNTAKLANLRRRAGRAGATNIKTVDIEGLQEYSELVKSGGRLVYATCTISREENEEVVNAFLEENKDFSVISPTEINPDIFGRFTAEDGFFRSLPNVHDMDGFFGAVMMREQ